MRLLYIFHVGLVLIKYSSAQRHINDHTDSGMCPGEFTTGNSPFVPQRYSLYLDLNPEEKTFQGDVNIMGTLSEYTDEVILHSVNLNVKSVRVNGLDVNDTTWFLDDTIGTLSIIMPSVILDSNLNNLVVGVSYDGVFNERDGIIMQHYNKTDKNRWVIFTNLQPFSARTVFPCIDLPKYKARFDVSIRNPGKRLVVLSNSPRKSRDLKVIKFQTTPLMSTYLVSFLVCDYVPVKIDPMKKTSMDKTLWVPREMEKKYGITLVKLLVPKLLEALEEYTGNKYSLPKLDMFVVMDSPGTDGMENWGLIMYQVHSLIQVKRTSASNLARVVSTIAHELAHHWFGNSVTVSDWCNMWLQEAIPTFLQGHISDAYSYDLDMVNRVKWTARKEIMSSDCVLNNYTQPMSSINVGSQSIFLLKHYYQGASLLYMVESIVTPEVFKKSLRSYIGKYNYSYAQENELWDIVEKEVGEGGVRKKLNAPKSLVEIINTWVALPNHPVVVLVRDKDGSLSVGQKICNYEKIKKGEWWIPISYTTSTEANFNNSQPRRWIAPTIDGFQPLDITLKDNEWIILNIMSTGFYRVQYDKLTWKLIIDQLKRDTTVGEEKAVIPPIHRAMLVDDSYYAANTGEELVKLFEIMEYVKWEKNQYVWDALNSIVSSVYFPKEENELFKKYVHFLLTDAFEKVSDVAQWKRTYFFTWENVNDRSLREWVFDLSHEMEFPAIFNFSRDVALQVINGKMDEKIIPPEVKNKLWCSAVSTGDLEVFEYLMLSYDSEEDDKKEAEILESLMCSKLHTRLLLDIILQSNEGENKTTLRESVQDFIYHHWSSECEEIISFIGENMMHLVDDKSQLTSLFHSYKENSPDPCKDKTTEMFPTKFSYVKEEKSQKWRNIYGLAPLNWLKDHERQWS